MNSSSGSNNNNVSKYSQHEVDDADELDASIPVVVRKPAQKSLFFARLPQLLCICLNRRVYDEKTGSMVLLQEWNPTSRNNQRQRLRQAKL